MFRTFNHVVLASAVGWIALVGCRARGVDFKPGAADRYNDVAAKIEYPAVSSCSECSDLAVSSLKPYTLTDEVAPDYWDVSLEQVVQMALMNSTTLHDLGGLVVRTPDATRTQYDPAIRETDPTEGIEAALSAFDAELTSDAFFEKNDRQLNNRFEGGGTRTFLQDLMNWDTGIRKRSVTGSEFSVRHHIDYDANNAPGNAFPSAFNSWIEGEVRHPLLQGSGTEFNRIAGPTQIPGQYNGVLIARLRTDVALTEFEIAVRDFVSNVENTYWDLYFAYRDLETKKAARDAALETWRRIYALRQTGRQGGEAEKEAQAREQFYRFQVEVQNALNGRLLDGTRTNNGSPGGSVRAGASGVLVTERRLRTLLGLPAADGRLLRPVDEPVVCHVEFDWSQLVQEATTRRAELRRQKWMIRRRELELIASKNHLMPRLDAVGRYRVRGFGKHLIGDATPPVPLGDPALDLGGESAYEQLGSGDYQEWLLGFELTMPLGFRRAHAGVRNAELTLARERALLCDMENELVRQVGDAVGEVDRAYVTYWTAHDRVLAAREQLEALEAKERQGVEVPLHLLLDAQTRLATAESELHRTATEFAVATKNVHFAKGTLLEHDGVFLNEGSWPAAAHEDAAELERRRGRPRDLNYTSRSSPIVSGGSYAQARAMAQLPTVHSDVMQPPAVTEGEDITPAPPEVPTPTAPPAHSELEPLPPLEGRRPLLLPPVTATPALPSTPITSQQSPVESLSPTAPFVPVNSLAEKLAAGEAKASTRPALTPRISFSGDGSPTGFIQQTSLQQAVEKEPTVAPPVQFTR